MGNSGRRSRSSRSRADEATQVIPFPFRAPASALDFPPEIARPLGAAAPAFDVDPDDQIRSDVAAAIQMLDAGRRGAMPMLAAVQSAIRKLGGDELLEELRALANDTTYRIAFEVTPAGRSAAGLKPESEGA